MKKRVIGGLGILLVVVTIVTTFTVRAASISNTMAQTTAKGKHPFTSCPPTDQWMCQGKVLVQSHKPEPPTPTPPTQAAPPTSSQPPPQPNTGTGTGGNGGNGGSGTSTEQQLALQLFNLINSDRTTQGGFPAYKLNSILSKGAYQHDIAMTTTNCKDNLHQCPGEPGPFDRITNEGIHWMAVAENVGPHGPDPDAWGAVKDIEAGMLGEKPPKDEHRQILLSTAYHQIGIGVLIDSQGTAWVTEDFTD